MSEGPRDNDKRYVVWLAKQPWRDYRSDVLLWVESTSIPMEKQVPGIMLHGIKPFHATLYRHLKNTFPQVLRITPKDGEYVHGDTETQSAVRRYTPIERLLIVIDVKEKFTDVPSQARRCISLFRCDRKPTQTVEKFIQQFEAACEEVDRDGVFKVQEQLKILALFFGLGLNVSQSETVRNHFKLEKAGEAGYDLRTFSKVVERHLGDLVPDRSGGAEPMEIEENMMAARRGLGRFRPGPRKGGKGKGKGYGKGKGKAYAAELLQIANEELAEWDEDWEEGGWDGAEEESGEEEDEEGEVEEDDVELVFLAKNECRFCGKTGHWERDCFKKQAQQAKNKPGNNSNFDNNKKRKFVKFGKKTAAAVAISLMAKDTTDVAEAAVDCGSTASCVALVTVIEFKEKHPELVEKEEPYYSEIMFGDGKIGTVKTLLTINSPALGLLSFRVYSFPDEDVKAAVKSKRRTPFLIGGDYLAEEEADLKFRGNLMHLVTKTKVLTLRNVGGLHLLHLVSHISKPNQNKKSKGLLAEEEENGVEGRIFDILGGEE
jgi:hypothetical protein